MFNNFDISLEFLMVLLLGDIAVDWFGCSILTRKPARYFAQLIDKILAERKRDVTTQERHDFIQLMIDAALTDKQLTDNGVLFFLAGFDTT